MTGLNKPVSDEQLERLDGKYKAIQDKLGAGALPFEQVLGAFQSVHDGNFGDTVVPVTHQRVRKIQLIHGLFVPPEVQIENVRHWNEQKKWGFGKNVLADLSKPPAWPDDRLVAVVLVPYLWDVQATFDGLWGIAASRQKNHWRWPDFRSDAQHLRLLQGIEHKPGLRWEVMDLAANWDRKDGVSPESVRSAASSPHAGILAAAAHHPKWVQAMDGVKLPHVWIPGYEATIPGCGRWQCVPYLVFYRDDREVHFGADDRCHRNPLCAVPALRG
ncbi:MAG: hypothetical protein WAP74_01510 [Patescibacteria group bacterium]